MTTPKSLVWAAFLTAAALVANAQPQAPSKNAKPPLYNTAKQREPEAYN